MGRWPALQADAPKGLKMSISRVLKGIASSVFGVAVFAGAAQAQVAPTVQNVATQIADNAEDFREMAKILNLAGVGGLSEMQLAQALCFATDIAQTDAPIAIAFNRFAARAETDISLLETSFNECDSQAIMTAAAAPVSSAPSGAAGSLFRTPTPLGVTALGATGSISPVASRGVSASGAFTLAGATGATGSIAGLSPTVQSVALQIANNTDSVAIARVITQASANGMTELQVAQSLCFAQTIAATDTPIALAFTQFAQSAETDLAILEQAFSSCSGADTGAGRLETTTSLFTASTPPPGGGGPSPNPNNPSPE